MMQKLIPTHFKLNYQYREYHFSQNQLKHSEPKAPKNTRVSLSRIHSSDNLLGLILALHKSFAMSAKKTALLLRLVFGVSISGQTVLNYAEAAAHYCHKFNLKYKGPIDDISAGDETYIKVKGKHHYVFFFISPDKKTITAYNVDDNRSALPAVIAMLEAKRTADREQKLTFVTDGNPSYQAGLHFINNELEIGNIIESNHIKVIGLKNLDKDSTEYRSYKQIIERLNRTYKQHTRPFAGFNKIDSAITLTTLFVTHYNFLRSHKTLDYKVPVKIKELDQCNTLQEKWLMILSMSA
jgi:transposase-like protein